jgi:hypothetical protein
MSTSNSWIDNALEKYHLREDVIDEAQADQYRLVIGRSRLLERMDAIAGAINLRAGRGLIFTETFQQPHCVFRRCSVDKEEIESSMALVIKLEGPTMIFTSSNLRPWLRRIGYYRRFGIQDSGKVKCELAIDPERINDTDLQAWFTYLLSGLQHSVIPRPRIPSLKTN